MAANADLPVTYDRKFQYGCRFRLHTECERVFESLKHLRHHYQGRHNLFDHSVRVDTCGQCGKKFDSKAKFTQHENIDRCRNQEPPTWWLPCPVTHQERVDTWIKQADMRHSKLQPSAHVRWARGAQRPAFPGADYQQQQGAVPQEPYVAFAALQQPPLQQQVAPPAPVDQQQQAAYNYTTPPTFGEDVSAADTPPRPEDAFPAPVSQQQQDAAAPTPESDVMADSPVNQQPSLPAAEHDTYGAVTPPQVYWDPFLGFNEDLAAIFTADAEARCQAKMAAAGLDYMDFDALF